MATYSREGLIQRLEQGDLFEYLLFYGHKVEPDGSASASCLSQWFPAVFNLHGVLYPTAEHYMMAEKARLFKDDEALAQIIACKTPKEAKALGRKVRNFDDRLWGAHCSSIVVKANLAKFLQNERFATWLLSTTPQVLVEASPFDRIWGIGMGKSNPAATDPRLWHGANLLGFALMKVRDNLAGTCGLLK